MLLRDNVVFFQKKARDWAMIANTLLTDKSITFDAAVVSDAQAKAKYFALHARFMLLKLLNEGE